MPSVKRHFRQTDVTALIKAAVAGGLQVGRIEVEPAGKIVLYTPDEKRTPETDLDKWLDSKHARSA